MNIEQCHIAVELARLIRSDYDSIAEHNALITKLEADNLWRKDQEREMREMLRLIEAALSGASDVDIKSLDQRWTVLLKKRKEHNEKTNLIANHCLLYASIP